MLKHARHQEFLYTPSVGL